MYIIVWEYIVKPEHQTEFEKVYGPNGAWVQLFKQSAAYLGTDLLHDLEMHQRYITMDRWSSPEAFEYFQHEHHAEYETLDRRCNDLTERETRLGTITA